MGDADLYVSQRDTAGKWDAPRNLGYPINTPSNENGLIDIGRRRTAYYSSRLNSTGWDLYSFALPPTVKPIYVTYVKGTVRDKVKNKQLAA